MNLIGARHIYFHKEKMFADGGRMSPATVIASNVPTREYWRLSLADLSSRELSPYSWLMRHEWFIKDALHEANWTKDRA